MQAITECKSFHSPIAKSSFLQNAARLIFAAAGLLTSIGGLAVGMGGCGQRSAEVFKHDSEPQNAAATYAHMGAVVIDRNIGANQQADARDVLPPSMGGPKFSAEDEKLLDEVSRACFEYFWRKWTPTGMIPDRTSVTTVSVAGVGFQLSALVIGVERGWISKSEGAQRAMLILQSLEGNRNNRKEGMFYHFVAGSDAGQPTEAYEHVVSTIDSALLFSGVLTASAYFGGDVATVGDRLFAQANWQYFQLNNVGPDKQEEKGFVSLAWKPTTLKEPFGEGKLSPHVWIDSGCEHRLVMFLAACAPKSEHRIDGQWYYKLRRMLGEYPGVDSPLVWFPWSGALFTNFFSHCWIEYAAMLPDDPKKFGVSQRAQVDWWENSRRAVKLHQVRGQEHGRAAGLKGWFPAEADPLAYGWGLTASDYVKGYQVPGVFPTMMQAARFAQPPMAKFDYSPSTEHAGAIANSWGDGTISPYGAASCIMFDPKGAIGAMRYYRNLTNVDGKPLVWRSVKEGGYGFVDGFNLKNGWVGKDYLAIDQGPMLLAIENARTGLVWRVFSSHRWVKEGEARLGLKRR